MDKNYFNDNYNLVYSDTMIIDNYNYICSQRRYFDFTYLSSVVSSFSLASNSWSSVTFWFETMVSMPLIVSM